MTHDQGVPMFLWSEACNAVVYVHNMCPYRRLRDTTPDEAFSKVKPKIDDLHIFGCLVYIHIPREKRMKLDPSGRKGIFVGYSEFVKAYQIYLPGQRRIELSKDVTFEEDVSLWRSRHADGDNDEQEDP